MLHPAEAQFLQNEQRLPPAARGYLSAAVLFGFFAAAVAVRNLVPQLDGLTSSILLYLLLGTGFALEIRVAGVPDFAFTVWFAIGAWCEVLMTRTFAVPFWICLPAGAAVAAGAAVCFVSPLLRMRREIIAVVTLGFGALVQILSWAWISLRVPIIPAPAADLQYPGLLTIAALACLVSWRIRRSSLALMLRAANEDETACNAIGVDSHRCRIIIVAAAGMIAGAGGCLFAAGKGGITSADFDIRLMAVLLVIAVFAGRRSQAGVAVAAILAAAASQFFVSSPALLLVFAGAGLLCWPALRSIDVSLRRSARPGDLPDAETVVEAAE